ncbi:MAG: ATP-binding protein, partial [Bacteroidota bacterium]
HHLNLMHRNGKRLYELINQLLDLSRLEAGKLELSLQEGDIISFIKGVAHSFESLAASKEIHYQLTIPDQPQLVAFDPDKLQKILTNLLSNAFKYTPEEGQVDLQVTTDPESVKIAVSDSGMGIPEEQQAQIFDRFYRVEGSEVEGVGIGLALTKELVQLHEGHIDLESRIGKGTRIRVELPLRPAGTEALPRVSYQAEDIFSPAFTPVKTLKAQVPPEVNLQGEILIVEDNADVRELVGQALVKNFIIREAEDGEQGLLMARNYLPDLIVTDVMMPKLDGQAMTARLKEDELTCHIPIVMLTAKGDSPSKLAGLETGADDYLTKPFDEKELLTRVRNLIKQRKLLREKFSEADGLKLKEVSVNSTDQAFLDRVMGILEAKVADEQFSVEVFAQEVGLSRAQLHRRIKALTDMSPSILVRTVRLHRAKSLLMQGAGTAAEISYLVGFSSPAYFSKCFKDQFGLSPTEVRPGENKSSSPDSHL